MYLEHFGLNAPPFKITPDPQLFYAGGERGLVLEALVYAITQGEGMVKVVGEVGSGKTMLCRMLPEKLPPSIEILYLANPRLTPDTILQAIALEMRLPIAQVATANHLQVMHALHAALLQKHADNQQVVLLIEEAQGMPLDTLEEIRLLSNLETTRHKLLQIVLFGQPELDTNLAGQTIRQLRERITHSFYLSPLARPNLADYLDFRMRAVGYRGPPVFSAAAIKQLHHHAQGLLRRSNILADKALLAAFADNQHQVLPKHVQRAAQDSGLNQRWRISWLSVGLLGLLLLSSAVLYLTMPLGLSPLSSPPSTPTAAPAAPAAIAPLLTDQHSPSPASPAPAVSNEALPPADNFPTLSLLQQRVLLSRDWLQKKRQNAPYTLQLMQVAHQQLNTLLAQPYLQGLRAEIYLLPDAKGLNWRLFLGEYPSYQAALKHLQQLPAELSGGQPFARRIDTLQQKAKQLDWEAALGF